MTRLLSTATLILALFFALPQQGVSQDSGLPEEGTFKIGGGLAFGSGVGFGNLDNDLGIRADGYYSITPEIRAGGDFTFYFPKSESQSGFGGNYDYSINVWELNLNGHYIFMENDGLLLYGLAGINITGMSWEQDYENQSNQSNSSSETGLNLGGGVEYPLDFADLFGEIKIGGLGGNADQFVLGAGLRFGL